MTGSESLNMRVAPWAVPSLVLTIFVLDLLTPVGLAVWLLYSIPLVLAAFSARPRNPLYLSAIATVLTAVGFYLSPERVDLGIAASNRMIGVGLLWAFSWAILAWKQARVDTTRTTEALSVERVERAHAEGLMQAAQEARAYADTALLGATASRQAAESSLVASRLRMEGLIQSAMDAIISVDQDQKVVLFNRAAERMFGCAAGEAMGQSIDRFIPERFRGAHQNHVRSFGTSGVTSRKMGALGTISGLRANGEEFPLEAAISQVRVDGAQFSTVILRDISERRRAEELLRDSEERYRNLIEVSPDAIFLLRGDRIELANPRALALLGAKEEGDVVGRSCYDFLAPESKPLVRDRFHHLAEGAEQMPVVEEQLRGLDGRLIDVEVTSSRLRDGGSLAIQSVMRDITERKRLQEHLRRTERLAELGTLASGMAHEIGTPMNVIMGRAEHLMQRTADERTKKGLQIIITQVERITKIMNQLLSMARRRPGERKPADMRRIIEDCLEVLQERLKRHKVQIVKDYAPQPSPAVVDSDQMSQVLLNLFLNADQAMAEGGTLRIGLRSEKGQVILTVGDTGQGIPEDNLPKIFAPFFTTKEIGKGTGLGLSVVHGIIEEHQGTISVLSEVGKGTTFTITLPGARAEGT